MDRVALLEHWYRQVYIEGELDAVDTLFDDTLSERGLMPGMQSAPEDIRVFAAAMSNLVEEPRFHIVKAVESDDWLCALIEAEARRADDGAPIYVMGQLMVRFVGDKIAEAYNSFDFIAFFEQLKLLPEHSVALGMTGQKLA